MQAVRRILDGEENHIAIRAGLAGMHDIGRHINHRARFGFDGFAVDGGMKDAFQNIDPLLVGMRMGFGAGAGMRIKPTIIRSPSTQEPFAVE